MEAYRITREKYASDLSGEGAKLYGGRWNRPGVPAIYLSEARSLALLELLVHFNSAAALKLNYVFITLNIPKDDIVSIGSELQGIDLHMFNNEHLWEITDHYFYHKKVLGLRVPSVIIPDEYNIILNPTHALMNEITIKSTQSAIMDPRLIKNW